MKFYILTVGGKVQHIEQPCGWVLPIFADHAEAKAVAKKNGASVALIGSVKGETLNTHLDAAALQGVKGMLIQNGVGRFFQETE